jgi:hypothetical protein
LSLAAALLLARDRCVCLLLPLECEPAKPRCPRRTHKELSFNILFAHTGDFSSDLFCGGFLRVVLGGISFEGGIGYRTTTPGASFCFLGRDGRASFCCKGSFRSERRLGILVVLWKAVMLLFVLLSRGDGIVKA